jgi:hypothetical protein
LQQPGAFRGCPAKSSAAEGERSSYCEGEEVKKKNKTKQQKSKRREEEGQQILRVRRWRQAQAREPRGCGVGAGDSVWV